MLAAFDLGLINGDYAFIHIRRRDNRRRYGDDTWEQVFIMFMTYGLL